MLPHEGIGGCTPMPKKLKPASSRMAEAKLAAETTMMGLRMLGKICLKIMRKFLKPKARPASTKVVSRMERICPRTIRATSTHMVKPTAMKTCAMPLPNAKVIAMTNSRVGMDQTTLMNHTTASSTLPRKNPPKLPIMMPIIRLKSTAMKPTVRLMRLPKTKRLRKSRPNWSVPSRNFLCFTQWLLIYVSASAAEAKTKVSEPWVCRRVEELALISSLLSIISVLTVELSSA